MNEVSNHDEQWAIAEQWFMRGLGVGLLIVAVISMIFGIFPANRSNILTQAVNISFTMLLGVGALWSLWWSSDIRRMYNLIDGFKTGGSSRTYLVAVMQVVIGLLFASELLGGRLTLGSVGILILLSAIFYFWRARQISQASG